MLSQTKLVKRCEELSVQFLEGTKKLEKINKKIKNHETKERANIKEETQLVKRMEK